MRTYEKVLCLQVDIGWTGQNVSLHSTVNTLTEEIQSALQQQTTATIMPFNKWHQCSVAFLHIHRRFKSREIGAKKKKKKNQAPGLIC